VTATHDEEQITKFRPPRRLVVTYSLAVQARAERRCFWTISLRNDLTTGLSGINSCAEGEIMQTKLQDADTVIVTADNPAVTMHIDLKRVKMTDKQRAIVQKLFAQSPITECTEGEHSYAAERGTDGPGSKYLTKDEFESIRELGVRLGTSGTLAAAQCDFCLHCISLEAKPELGR
jgi:hypothetical protein